VSDAQRTRDLAAERQRRRRARQTDEEKADARVSDAERKARRRASPEYRALSPEERHREKGRKGLPFRQRPFVGVDGEAGYRHTEACGPDPTGCDCAQEYAALTVGDQTLRNPNDAALSTWDCLKFLTSQPRDIHLVGYFIDFDVTHILRDLPLAKRRQIAYPERASEDGAPSFTYVTDPASHVTYGIYFIAHKLFIIVRCGDPILDEFERYQHTDKGKVRRVNRTGRRIVIYDVSGYFQASFLQAISDWDVGTQAERELISRGKAGRTDFPLPLSDEIIQYNLLECKLLVALMTKLEAVAQGVGIDLTSYHGAGALAEALLKKYQITAYRGDPAARSRELHAAIDRGFFGGWFATSAVGIVPELHNFDIASAHPAAMVTLPCLAHGQWTHLHSADREVTDMAESTLLRVRWQVGRSDHRPFGPFPYRRRDGTLIYPLAGHGWYWKEEVQSNMYRFGADDFEIMEAWEFVPRCDHQPFAWLPALYEERLRLGKNSTGYLLKLGMNSLYGKFAQTAGGGGRHNEFVWAGMITARTRVRLMELATLGDVHAVMLATDGIYFDSLTEAVQLVPTYPTNPPLGAWEYDPDKTVYRNSLLIQSGLWINGERLAGKDACDGGNGRARGRTRGVGAKALSATDGFARLYEAWRQDGLEARVTIGPDNVLPGQSVPKVFVGLRTGFHLRKPHLIGTWQPLNKTISFTPEPKRLRTPRKRGESFVRTVPAMNDERLSGLGINPMLELSAPYRRNVRKHDAKDLYFEQPDHVDLMDVLAGEDD
jgi:hypothetical protein